MKLPYKQVKELMQHLIEHHSADPAKKKLPPNFKKYALSLANHLGTIEFSLEEDKALAKIYDFCTSSLNNLTLPIQTYLPLQTE